MPKKKRGRKGKALPRGLHRLVREEEGKREGNVAGLASSWAAGERAIGSGPVPCDGQWAEEVRRGLLRALGLREKSGPQGRKGEGEFLFFSFFFLFQKPFETHFKNPFKSFEILGSNTLITINKMQRHVRSNTLLTPIIIFNLMKNIICLYSMNTKIQN